MENDRLSNYLRARLRAMTYPWDDGLDDEAVRPQPRPEQQWLKQQQRQSELPPRKGNRLDRSVSSG